MKKMLLAVVCVCLFGFQSFVAMAAEEHPAAAEAVITLLVHGASPVNSQTPAEDCWGRWQIEDERPAWSGFVGYLASQGHRIGGIFRSSSELVCERDLDSTGSTVSGKGRIYLLSSSPFVQERGIVSRGKEIATTVAAIRRMHPQIKIRLICYSAGGLAARVWMQSAIEELPYQGEISHLVTLATSHAGLAGTSKFFSGALKKRYADLSVDSKLLLRLNTELALPKTCVYASIAVSSPLAIGEDVDPARFLVHFGGNARLPLGLPAMLARGGDDVVHVLSAQLQLTKAGGDYEKATGRGMRLRLVIPQPTLGRGEIRQATLHTVLPANPAVWELLEQEIAGDQQFNKAQQPAEWGRLLAQYESERLIMQRHFTAHDLRTRNESLETIAHSGGGVQIAWRNATDFKRVNLLAEGKLERLSTTGTAWLTFDRFGRPIGERDNISTIDND